MAAVPPDFRGKAFPMTVITLVPRWLRCPQQAIEWVFRLGSLSVVRQLAFIHFARWVVIPREGLPRLSDDQPQERLQDDLYVFSTNFNGPWDQYIDAFGMVPRVKKGLNWLWWSSRGFPGAWPMRNFKRYIHYFEYALDLYYNAYPGGSVRDITAAFAFESQLDKFLHDTRKEMSDEEFRRRYDEFLSTVAPYLGSIGGDPKAILSATHAQPRATAL